MKPKNVMTRLQGTSSPSETRAPRTALLCLALALSLSSSALAEDEVKVEENNPDGVEEANKRNDSGLGLAPGIPQAAALAGGFSPAYAPSAEDASTWAADFHGFLSMPMNIGFNTRAGDVTEDQYKTVMHAPPVVPEYRDAFSYTSALPAPYAQLNFSYGNQLVQANVILQTRAPSTGASYFSAATAGGISDAYLTFTPKDIHKRVILMAHVGAFTNRYGVTGQYDEGRYGTPLFARVNGIGENVIALLELSKKFDLELQHGFQGQIDKPPIGIVPGDWNDYADPNLGTSFANHVHAGLTYDHFLTLGGHYMNVFTADERANHGAIPDGKINLVGGDLRFILGRYGHFYAGVTHVDARDSRSVGRVVEVLNAAGGPGLMRSYFGPNGNGTGQLLIMGGQYDVSLARAIYGQRFTGQSRDIFLSAFAQRVSVKSDDADYDNKDMQKFGVEAGYSLLKYFATSLRFDRVDQDLTDVDESFSVLSPRLIFRTGWQSRDQVVLQYSKWFNGDEVYVRDGSPAEYDPRINPDEDVVSLSATMWW